ncbi:hypothetical protein AB0D59_50210 [Streptomyces sp. NPDC048417]|uniref:terpene synthase family protein n=1 Tax=Streptomyces sp. NPDC048417 TaxID=3155387 RepID=UPI0034283EA2
MTEPVTLPVLTCPFPRRAHPGAADAEKAVTQWLSICGFTAGSAQLDVHLASQFGKFAAMVYPEADPQRLALAAKWLAWLCVFDDQHLDENPESTDPSAMADILLPTLAVLTPPQTPAGPQLPATVEHDPLLRALQGLLGEIGEHASPAQQRRFVHEMCLALFGAFLDAGAWHAKGRLPDLAHYRVTRQHNGAVLACIALIDVLSGYEVPAAESDHPQVQVLRSIATNVICWANDVFSYPKEARRSRFAINLPTVLQHQYGHSPQESLQHAARLYEEEVAAYLRLEEQISGQASPQLVRHLAGLRAWIQGSHYWHLESSRFALRSLEDGAKA